MFGCGYNAYGQLGVASAGVKTFTPVDGIPTRVLKVACSANNSLALLSDGSVLSSGSGAHSRFQPVSRIAALKIPKEEKIITIACGPTDFFLLTAKALYRLPALSGASQRGAGGILTFTKVAAPSGCEFADVACGATFVVCLTTKGSLLSGGSTSFTS